MLAGVSVANDYDVNSLAVPRKAQEAIGAITRLTYPDGRRARASGGGACSARSRPAARRCWRAPSRRPPLPPHSCCVCCPVLYRSWHRRHTTLNVEYNQLDPLLRATSHPQGDANDPATGYSPFPGAPCWAPAGAQGHVSEQLCLGCGAACGGALGTRLALLGKRPSRVRCTHLIPALGPTPVAPCGWPAGNINQLVLKLPTYCAELARHGGVIAEFVNPKCAAGTCACGGLPRLSATRAAGRPTFRCAASFTCPPTPARPPTAHPPNRPAGTRTPARPHSSPPPAWSA